VIVTAAANGLDDDLTQMVATGVGVNAVSNYLKCYSLSLSPPGRRRLRLSALVQVAPMMARGRSESVRIFRLPDSETSRSESTQVQVQVLISMWSCFIDRATTIPEPPCISLQAWANCSACGRFWPRRPPLTLRTAGVALLSRWVPVHDVHCPAGSQAGEV
jgi:hypothetical protein